MDLLPIAELRPELYALESKHIKAVVSLVWPYSSAQREFALLLAEPDFRLRLKKGQTRVRFTRSSAKALAATGIGIGDTVILGLQGVQFVEKDAGITTPGRSIDWELAFSQTLVVHIFRDGNEIATLNIVDAAPTPAQSPTRMKGHTTPTQTPLSNRSLQLGDGPRWSSPAFLKRSRLSDGSFFDAGHDSVVEENVDGHDKKRRRKSYKDWNVWTYAKRTPSPEKERPIQKDLTSSPTRSSIRRPSLPASPVSPSKTYPCSIAGLPIERTRETEPDTGHGEEKGSRSFEVDDEFSLRNFAEKKSTERKATTQEFERDADYYDLYAGPDELPPADTQYTFGGDTEENTEVEDDAIGNGTDNQEVVELSSPTEADSDEYDEEEDILEESRSISAFPSSELENQRGTGIGSIAGDNMDEIDEKTEEDEMAVGSTSDRSMRERSGTHEDPIGLDDDNLPTVMLPPLKLSSLQTNFPILASGTLTPIGKEPRSPTLKPLDSSTLPMPSPFPGDCDGQLTSYLDLPSPNHLAQQGAQEPSSEASYIVESSFYSSVSAADARAGLPHHESAFTDVRFTFGMDGSTTSRPKEPSETPLPQGVEIEENQEDFRDHFETQFAAENVGEIRHTQEEPIAVHQDTLEEAEHILAIDQEDKENIFQGESETNAAEENVENRIIADEIANEAEGKAAIEQEIALQNELEQQLPSDMFDEFTNQNPSPADHDTAASLLSLLQSKLSPAPQPILPQPTQSEVIELSSGLESELDEDSSEGEPESEAEIETDANISEEDENDTDSDEGTEDDLENVQQPRATEVFSGDPPRTGEPPISADDRPIHSHGLPLVDRQQDPDDGEPLPTYQDSNSPNVPAIAVDIIDLGSGSGDDGEEESPARRESVVVLNNAIIDEMAGPQNTVSHPSQAASQIEFQDESLIDSELRVEVRPSTVAGGLREPISVGRTAGGFTAVNVAKDEQDILFESYVGETTKHTEPHEHDRFMAVVDEEHQLANDKEDDIMSDAGTTQVGIQALDREIPETLDIHPDIKMETIEDEDPFPRTPTPSSQQDDDQDSVMGPPAEILIEVPNEGDKIGALTTKAVAATAPARNTRSKTKSTISPVKDETPAPRPSTRSRRSKTSLTSGSMISPPRFDAKSRSTLSPVKDAMPTSPYSLRSQSKFLSPIKSILSPNITVERGSSHRKRRGRQQSDPPSSPLADSFGEPEHGRIQKDFPDTFDYQPSQELGSQTQIPGSGKYVNVQYVKDSEDGSLHSEHSITTASALWSDDSDGLKMLRYSDQAEPITQIRDGPVSQIRDIDLVPSKLPAARQQFLGASPNPKARLSWKLSQDEDATEKTKAPVQPDYPFITNEVLSSPVKAPQSSYLTKSSPHKPRRKEYDLSSDSEAEAAAEGSTTPKALSVAGQVILSDPALEVEGENDQVSRSSTPLAELDFSWTQDARTQLGTEAEQHIPSSPPSQHPTATSISRQSLMNSDMPLTPNTTQSGAQSQPSFSVTGGQMEQSMLITPQLTQRTSTGLRSFVNKLETNVEPSAADEILAGLRGQSTTLNKSTPRRNTTTADIASPERSPSVHSEDLSDSETETQTLINADLGPPSIGLSTPISYYTPLKDLRFFLNRSSQFVENPDVLALVVSESTLPKKADKGPKHWSTTLSITDLSSHPTITTVQIFRPFAKALPVAEKGDVILLRCFTVKSLNRKVMLRSGEESAWCVWRYGKPIWGHKKGKWGEVQAREEIRGPEVEKGADEWAEIERLRGWWLSTVRGHLEDKVMQGPDSENIEAEV